MSDLEQGFLRFEEAGEAAGELDRARLEPTLREAIAKFDEAERSGSDDGLPGVRR